MCVQGNHCCSNGRRQVALYCLKACSLTDTLAVMGGATIGSGGYKYPPLSKVYPPPGGYRGYKLVARGGTN